MWHDYICKNLTFHLVNRKMNILMTTVIIKAVVKLCSTWYPFDTTRTRVFIFLFSSYGDCFGHCPFLCQSWNSFAWEEFIFTPPGIELGFICLIKFRLLVLILSNRNEKIQQRNLVTYEIALLSYIQIF